jgi:tRNA-(ms[2]io[6]A)-hydroxylase
VAFLFGVPLQPRWQRGLSALAREELAHFERTLKLAAARGLEFVPQEPTDFAARLEKGAATVMPERLVDELLIAAVIGGRSCERMRLLATVLAALPWSPRLHGGEPGTERG